MIRFLPTTSPFLHCFRWLTPHFEGNHNIFLSDTILLKTQKFKIFMNMPITSARLAYESPHGCLVNSAQNQLGPIPTWPKTNSAHVMYQLGPNMVHVFSCIIFSLSSPYLSFYLIFFFLSWMRLSNGIEIQDTWVRVGLCLAVHTVRSRPTNCTNNNSQPYLLVFKLHYKKCLKRPQMIGAIWTSDVHTDPHKLI